MILWTKTDFWPCVYAIFWRYFEKSRIFSRALVFCWHCKNVTSWPPFIKVKKFEQLFLLLRRSAAKKLRTNAIFTKFFFSLLKLSSSANMRDYNFRGKKWPNLQWHKHYVEKEKWGLAITFFLLPVLFRIDFTQHSVLKITKNVSFQFSKKKYFTLSKTFFDLLKTLGNFATVLFY